jgi:class 3 adenylate cyclase
MDSPTGATGSRHQHLRSTTLIAVFILTSLVCVWFGQFVAAALVPALALLLHALRERDQRARALALRIADGRTGEKVEVPGGAWGELARAINGLLQERRVERRLREALPEPLPLEAVQSLLGGELMTEGKSRPVAVLLVGAPVRAPAWERGVRHTGLAAWQALAREAHAAAQRYGALLQPCGDAVMLVFGAFEERTTRESLRDALDAADLIQRSWRVADEGGPPLALALSSGYALTAALPGLGFCVVGTPVEQAVGLQQLATRARRFGLLCGEEAYQALRRDSHALRQPGAAWQPTDLRVSVANRPPQVVYRWSEASPL